MFAIELIVPLILPMFAVDQPVPVAAPLAPLSDALPARDPDYERARGDTYLRLAAGLVTTKDSQGPNENVEFNEGYLFSVAFGKRMTSGDRPFDFNLELEALMTQQDASSSGTLKAVDDVTVGALMLNGLFEYGIIEQLSIYGGLGIGGAWVDVGTSSDALNSFDSDEGAFLAWQVRTGVQWQFTESVAASFGYRFLNIDDVNIDNNGPASSFDLETRQHVLELGVRFGF